MRIVPLEAGDGTVLVYGDAAHAGHDVRTIANAPPEAARVLVFFDSRGISGGWDGSLLQLVLDHLGDTPYLALARPLEMTTWATLLNVFALNRLTPEIVITNVGLVDCTPKKRSLCDNVLEQVRFTVPDTASAPRMLEPYRLSSGAVEPLYSLDYDDGYVAALRALAAARRIIAIKTPLVPPSLPLERARPASFFSQLGASNAFVDAIGCERVELGEFDRTQTYDGVHWTRDANRLIFDRLRPLL
jgi:hypothetical protein